MTIKVGNPKKMKVSTNAMMKWMRRMREKKAMIGASQSQKEREAGEGTGSKITHFFISMKDVLILTLDVITKMQVGLLQAVNVISV